MRTLFPTVHDSSHTGPRASPAPTVATRTTTASHVRWSAL